MLTLYNTIARKCYACTSSDPHLPSLPATYQPTQMITSGWKLLVEWKDGNSSWVSLSDMKDSYSLETAEYSIMNKILTEPAFAWWVPHVLRKRNQKINKVNSKYWKRTHKFGIRLPYSVEEALQIDEETGTDYWRKANEKEMKNMMPAFEFHNDDNMPVGYAKFQCHMAFDVKTGDSTRKGLSKAIFPVGST